MSIMKDFNLPCRLLGTSSDGYGTVTEVSLHEL